MKVGTNKQALIAEGHTPALASDMVDLTPSFSVPAHTLKGAVFVAPAAGTARVIRFTFAGTYVTGDIVRLTITDNSVSRQMWQKSYEYIVQNGDTVTDIADAFEAKINAEGAECPYTASNVAGQLNITSKQTEKKTLLGVEYTDSAAGTITAAIPTAGTNSEGQQSDLVAAGIPEDNMTLSSYDTVRINYYPDAAQPFRDSAGAKMVELIWFGTPGEGAALETLINSL